MSGLKKVIHVNKKLKIWFVIIGISLAVLLASLFLARGWIRGTLVPRYVEDRYGHQVDATFNETYLLVQKLLQPAGFTFNEPPADTECQKLDDTMSSLSYKGFRESVSCGRYQSSESRVVRDDFIASWKQQAPVLEKYLTTTGWTEDKQYNYDNRLLAHLYDSAAPGDTSSVMIAYDKHYGKIMCTIQVYYELAMPDPQPATALTSYQCHRTVEFFGGYSYYSDGP